MKSLITLFLLINVIYAQTNVVVSILPQQTFVEKIGGNKVKVTTMVKPGSDPHSYEPKASQMKDISNAKIYFPIGLEFENTWLDKFASQNKNMKFIETTQGITFLKMKKHSHEHHEENDLPYEWAGVFELKKGTYNWSFSKINGNYADATMKMLIIKANKKSDDLIESYEQNAKDIFSKTKTTIAKNNNTLKTNNAFYKLTFDEKKNITNFSIKIKEEGKYLFFTEHLPFEFEDKEHFFKDLAKNDIETIASFPKDDGHESHHHDNQRKDPHIWTSPSNVKIMAKNIYDTLLEFDPSNKEYFKKNYSKFIEEINQTDKKIKDILSVLPKDSKFMVFHPSWGYFANEYNLIQLSIEVEGKEAKPRIIQKIIDEAKEENVKAIFTQLEFSDKSAKAIANELKIKVLKETPLAKNWSENLIKMANAIANNE